MKTYQKLFLICLAFVMIFCICACDTTNTPKTDGTTENADGSQGTTTTPDGTTTPTPGGDGNTDGTNPPDAPTDLRDFEQSADMIGIKMDSGREYFVDYATLEDIDRIMLKELVENYFSNTGMDFDNYTFTVNGRTIGPDDYVRKGEFVVAKKNGTTEVVPGSGEMSVDFVAYDPSCGRESGTRFILIGESITLKAFYETYISHSPNSFEAFSATCTWYVNGESAKAETVLHSGDELFAKRLVTDDGGSDIPSAGTNGNEDGEANTSGDADTSKPGSSNTSNSDSVDTSAPGGSSSDTDAGPSAGVDTNPGMSDPMYPTDPEGITIWVWSQSLNGDDTAYPIFLGGHSEITVSRFAFLYASETGLASPTSLAFYIESKLLSSDHILYDGDYVEVRVRTTVDTGESGRDPSEDTDQSSEDVTNSDEVNPDLPPEDSDTPPEDITTPPADSTTPPEDTDVPGGDDTSVSPEDSTWPDGIITIVPPEDSNTPPEDTNVPGEDGTSMSPEDSTWPDEIITIVPPEDSTTPPEDTNVPGEDDTSMPPEDTNVPGENPEIPVDPVSGITIMVFTQVADGNIYTNEVYLDDYAEITLYEFVNNYSGTSYDVCAAYYTFSINGMEVGPDWVLYDGDTLYLTQISSGTPDMPVGGITVTLYCYVQNEELVTQEVVAAGYDSITLRELIDIFSGDSYDDYAASYEFLIDGVAVGGDYVLCGGEEIYLTPIGSLVFTFEIVSPEGTFDSMSVTLSGSEVTLSAFLETYFGGNMSYEDTVGQGYWEVNGAIADGSTIIRHADTVRFTAAGSDINPDAPEIYTVNLCTADGELRNCSFSMAVGEVLTLDRVLTETLGYTFTDLSAAYEIQVDGVMATSGEDSVPNGAEIRMSYIAIVDPMPTEEYIIYGAKYYGSMDEYGNITSDWKNGYKYNYQYTSATHTLFDAIMLLGLDLAEGDIVYLNGAVVTDLDNTYITESVDIVILESTISFEGLTVTVNNTLTGITSYSTYAAPVWSHELRETFLADVDLDTCTYRVSAGSVWNWNIYDELPLAGDVTITIAERSTVVSIEYVTSDGTKQSIAQTITGALPTFDEFAATYLDPAVSYRYFYFGGGSVTEFYGDDTVIEYYAIIVPADRIPETITVTYSVTYSEMETYTGSFTISAPMTVADAFASAEGLDFDYNEFIWNAYNYQISVNGETLSDSKGCYFTVIYSDTVVTVEPVDESAPETITVYYNGNEYILPLGTSLYDVITIYACEDYYALEQNGYWTNDYGETLDRDTALYTGGWIYYQKKEVALIEVNYNGSSYHIESGVYTFESFLYNHVGVSYWDLLESGYWESDMGLGAEVVLYESCTINYVENDVVESYIYVTYNGMGYELSYGITLYDFIVNVACEDYDYMEKMGGYWTTEDGMYLDRYSELYNGCTIVYQMSETVEPTTICITYNGVTYEAHNGITLYDFIVKFACEDYDYMEKMGGYWTTEDGMYLERYSELYNGYTIVYQKSEDVSPEVMICITYNGCEYYIDYGSMTFGEFLGCYIGQDYWDMNQYGYWESSMTDLYADTVLYEDCTINYVAGGFVPPVDVPVDGMLDEDGGSISADGAVAA